MAKTDVKELLDAGVHFGHLTRKWNPNMAPYIYMERDGIHIINLYKTAAKLEEAVNRLSLTVPEGPTSLHAAFSMIRPLEPKPDNIYLLVDGLPTMGEIEPTRAGVTGRERQSHFNRAARQLPFNVPVNVILYAMEGDPQAAPAYWWMALNTGGSLIAPSEDWP